MTWMTYKEASGALGVAIPSVKQRARRSRWARQAGNDGQARIDVPAELLSAPTRPDTKAPTSPASTPPTSPVSEMIERLQVDLSQALTSLAVAEAKLARADDLAGDLRADRDAWRDLANRPWWRRLAG